MHTGPIASGNQVMEDPEIFALLADDVRKVLGVEMEAAAIGAHAQQLRYAIVMKAVMDHADPDKSDNFKPFAARASAEVLIDFLRQNLPPRTPSP